METRVEKTAGRPWTKYSLEFKRDAVDRLLKGESGSVIARELNIRRKFLYDWRNKGFGSTGVLKVQGIAGKVDPVQQQLAKKQQRIEELERLAGQQAAQLDFFAAALRAVKEPRPNNGASSGSGSTQRSKP